MKLLFASDLHGSAYYAEKLEELIRNRRPTRLSCWATCCTGPATTCPEYDPKK